MHIPWMCWTSEMTNNGQTCLQIYKNFTFMCVNWGQWPARCWVCRQRCHMSLVTLVDCPQRILFPYTAYNIMSTQKTSLLDHSIRLPQHSVVCDELYASLIPWFFFTEASCVLMGSIGLIRLKDNIINFIFDVSSFYPCFLLIFCW